MKYLDILFGDFLLLLLCYDFLDFLLVSFDVAGWVSSYEYFI